MIKLQVIGHLGKDANSNTVNGKNVINFSVAHTEKFRDAQGNQKDRTIWVECAYWTDRTGVLPYLKKGTLVFAEGSPEVRNYTTKDGNHGSSLTMRISSVQLLGGRNEGQNEYGGGATADNSGREQPMAGGYNRSSDNSASFNNNSDVNDDLPF